MRTERAGTLAGLSHICTMRGVSIDPQAQESSQQTAAVVYIASYEVTPVQATL